MFPPPKKNPGYAHGFVPASTFVEIRRIVFNLQQESLRVEINSNLASAEKCSAMEGVKIVNILNDI